MHNIRIRTIVMSAAGIVALIGTAALADPTLAAGARARTHVAAKAVPTIKIRVLPSPYPEYDSTFELEATVTGSKYLAGGEITTNYPAAYCGEIDLVKGHGTCVDPQSLAPVGLHTLKAHYSGDAHYKAGSASLPYVVGKSPTSVQTDMQPEIGVVNSSVVVTVDLQDAAGQSAFGGTVSFYNEAGGKGCRRVPAKPFEPISCTMSFTNAGTNFIDLVYTGSHYDDPTSVQLPYQVQQPAGLSLTTTALPGGSAGTPYRFTLAAAGGSPPYTWKIVAGGLPDGLTLGKGGAITGTPTRTGKWSVTPAVTDASGATTSRAFTLKVT